MTDEKINKRKRKLFANGILLIVLLALIVFAISFAWFSDLTGQGEKNFSAGVQKVDYSFNGEMNDLFRSLSEIEISNDYLEDDTEIEDGNYIAATSLSFAIGEDPVDTDYSLTKGSNIRLTAVKNPDNSTDRISWSSSDQATVAVSRYGKIFALGDVGESAVITATAVDRLTGETRDGVTVSIRVTILKKITEDDVVEYLPAGSEILKKPLGLVNYSTCDSKARIRITWRYESLYEGELTDRIVYNVSDTLGEYSGTKVSLFSGVEAPLILDFSKDNGKSVLKTLDRGISYINFVDDAGQVWEVTELILTEAQHAALQTAVEANDLSTFAFDRTMLNAADAYFIYSLDGVAVGDYGDAIAPTAFSDTPTEAEITAATINLIDQITVGQTYTQFSPQKAFGVSVTFQARQADYFVLGSGTADDAWFDVVTCDWDGTKTPSYQTEVTGHSHP